jgi:hypothetical protein
MSSRTKQKSCPNYSCYKKYASHDLLAKHMMNDVVCKNFLIPCTGCTKLCANALHLKNHQIQNRNNFNANCTAVYKVEEAVSILSIRESNKILKHNDLTSVSIEQYQPSTLEYEQSNETFDYGIDDNVSNTVDNSAKKRKRNSGVHENFNLKNSCIIAQQTQSLLQLSATSTRDCGITLETYKNLQQELINAFSLRMQKDGGEEESLSRFPPKVTLNFCFDANSNTIRIDECTEKNKSSDTTIYKGVTSNTPVTYNISSSVNNSRLENVEERPIDEDGEDDDVEMYEKEHIDSFNYPTNYFNITGVPTLSTNEQHTIDLTCDNDNETIETMDSITSHTQYITKRVNDVLKHNNESIINNTEKCLLELYHMHRKCRAPIGLFDKTIDWVKKNISNIVKSSNGNQFTFHELPRRETFVKRMYHQVYGKSNIQKVLPKLVDVKVQELGNFTVKATLFDTREVLVDMLCDSELMDTRNQDWFDPLDPFNDYPLRSNIKCPSNSHVHQRATARLCKKKNDIAWPIGMYNDEINFDKFGKLQLDPWTICFLKNKRHIRNQPWAWRMIGIVHGIDSTIFKKKMKSSEKSIVYHKVLSHLLEDIKIIQQEGGIPHNLKFGQKLIPVNLIPYVKYVIGDTKGHENITGRFNSHTDGMAEG